MILLKRFNNLLPLVIFLFISSITNATIRTYIGPDNDLWNDANNWSPIGVPASSDTVNIFSGDIVNIGSPTATIRRLHIDNESILIIRDGGALNIHGIDGLGTWDYAIYVEQGRLYFGDNMNITSDSCGGILIGNNGLLEGIDTISIQGLDEFGDEAIRNLGTVNIDGTLIVDSINYISVWNFNEFNIEDDGNIQISHVDGRGLQNTGDMTNHGIIILQNIVDEGFYNSGVFHNYGMLMIDSIDHDGVFSPDTLYNYTSGNISISNTLQSGVQAYGLFINEGGLQCSNTSEGLFLANNSFHNTGNIQIDSTQNEGILFRDDVLINEGTIEITRVQDGINAEAFGDSLVNYGTITIHNTRGIGFLNAVNYTNHLHAKLDIMDTGSSGIILSNNLNNFGSIYVDQCQGDGFSTDFISKTITNYQSGLIDIQNCTGNPFIINENITFNSLGLLDIK